MGAIVQLVVPEEGRRVEEHARKNDEHGEAHEDLPSFGALLAR